MALLWKCAVDHGGDWHGLLETLHRAGSVEWQWAIRRSRTLMRFERDMEIDLAALIGIPDSMRVQPSGGSPPETWSRSGEAPTRCEHDVDCHRTE